jgi:YD repeat-containing protein
VAVLLNWTHEKDGTVWVARDQQYDEANRVASGGASDGSGNTTSLATNTFGYGLEGTYDAWGRLVKAKSTSRDLQVTTYVYDAFGRQITLHEDVIVPVVTNPHRVNHREFYYGLDGQVVEERATAGSGAAAQYVRTPDGRIIVRDRDADGNSGSGDLGKSGSGLEERLYATFDAAGSITAVIDGEGGVVERYIYDATGSVQVLDAWGNLLTFTFGQDNADAILGEYFVAPLRSFLAPTASLAGTRVAWSYLWHGMRLDRIPGLYVEGGSAFNPRLDRWMSPRPALEGRPESYTYSDEQMERGWWGAGWNSFWHPGQYGAAGEVTQPLGVRVVQVGGLIIGAALTGGAGAAALGLSGTAATLFSLGIVPRGRRWWARSARSIRKASRSSTSGSSGRTRTSCGPKARQRSRFGYIMRAIQSTRAALAPHTMQ